MADETLSIPDEWKLGIDIRPSDTFEQAYLKSLNARGVTGLKNSAGNDVYPPVKGQKAYGHSAVSKMKNIFNKLDSLSIEIDGKDVRGSDLTLAQINTPEVIKKLWSPELGALNQFGNSLKYSAFTDIRALSNVADLSGAGTLNTAPKKLGQAAEGYFHSKENKARDIIDLPPRFHRAYINALANSSKSLGRMDQLFGLLKYETGMRLEEMGKISINDIDWDKGLINIPESKTGNVAIMFSDTTREILAEIVRERDNHQKVGRIKDGFLFPNGHSTHSDKIKNYMRKKGVLNLGRDSLTGNPRNITVQLDFAGSESRNAPFETRMLRNNMESMVGDFSPIESKMVTGRASLSEAQKYVTSGEGQEYGKRALRILESRRVGYANYISPQAYLSAFGIGPEKYIGQVSNTIDSMALTSLRIRDTLDEVVKTAISIIPPFGFEEDDFTPNSIKSGADNIPGRASAAMHPDNMQSIEKKPNYDKFNKVAVGLTKMFQEGISSVEGKLNTLIQETKIAVDNLTRRNAISTGKGGAGRGSGGGRGGALKIPAGATLTADDVLRSGESIDWSRSNFSREDILNIRQAAVSRDPERVKEALSQAHSNSRSNYKKTVQNLLKGVQEGSATALKTLDNIAKNDTTRGIISLAAYLASFTGALGKTAAVGKKALLGEATAEVGIQSVFEPGSIGSKTSGDLTQLSQDELLQKMQSARDAEGGSELDYGRFGKTYGAAEVMGGQPLEGISPAPGAKTQGFATMPGAFNPDVATPWNPLTPLPKQKVSHQQLLEEEATGRYMDALRAIESSAASEEARKYELMSGAPPPEHAEEFGQQMTEGFAQSKQEALDKNKTSFMKEYEDYFKHMRY